MLQKGLSEGVLEGRKAFGMDIKNREYVAFKDFRYKFNGKETDSESETQDYGFRIYNPALGRFLSVDPLTKNYPMLTPYQFASDNPTMNVDLDGLEGGSSTGGPTVTTDGNATSTGNELTGINTTRSAPPVAAPSFPGSGENAASNSGQTFLDFNDKQAPNPGVLDLTDPNVTPQQVLNHFIAASKNAVANSNGILSTANYFNFGSSGSYATPGNVDTEIAGADATISLSFSASDQFQVLAFSTTTSSTSVWLPLITASDDGFVGNQVISATDNIIYNNFTTVTFSAVSGSGNVTLTGNNFYSSIKGSGTVSLQLGNGYKIENVLVGKFNAALQVGANIAQIRAKYAIPSPVPWTIPSTFKVGTSRQQ